MSSNSARVRFSAALGRASAPRPANGFRVAEPEPSGRSPLARLSFASTRAAGVLGGSKRSHADSAADAEAPRNALASATAASARLAARADLSLIHI